MTYSVVAFAREVLEMQERLEDQAAELAYLRGQDEKYHELLGSSLAHSQHMVGQTLRLLMTPGVAEACKAQATGAAS